MGPQNGVFVVECRERAEMKKGLGFTKLSLRFLSMVFAFSFFFLLLNLIHALILPSDGKLFCTIINLFFFKKKLFCSHHSWLLPHI